MLTARHRKALAFSVILGVSLYLVAIFTSDSEKILEAIQAFHFTDWLLILFVAFLNFIFRFLRWQMYIRHFGHILPAGLHFTYYLSGLALTTTPAKAGEILRSFYLVPHGVKWSQSLASFFSERFLDAFLVSMVSFFILDFIPGLDESNTSFLIPAISVMVLLLLSMQTRFPVEVIAFFRTLIPYKRLHKVFALLRTLIENARELLIPRYLLPGILFGCIAWFMHGAVFYLVTTKAGFEIELTTAIVLYGFSILAGAVSMIPGGIGATEIVLGLLLGYLGAETHIAVIAPILTRLATLWYATTIGLLANSYLGARNIHPQQVNGKE